MSNAHIEVEQRGPLTSADFTRLNDFFHEHGTFKEHKDRVFIDYADSFSKDTVSNRTRDIRLRATNGTPEIIVKLGNWGGGEQRRELSALSPGTPFDVLVEIFAALDITKGILCVRKITVYEWQDIEFALVEVPGHSYFFEAELIAHDPVEAAAAQEKIEQVCHDLDLKLFTKEAFFTYIDTLNSEANEPFDATTISHDYFKNRFSI